LFSSFAIKTTPFYADIEGMTDSQFGEIRYALAQICAILLMDKLPDRNAYNTPDADILYSKDLLETGDFLKDSIDRILQSFEKHSRQSRQK
jgi:hypothetical protein